MRKIVLAVGFLVFIIGTGAFGDTVELPLNCTGTYDINTPYWMSNFDLGVTFSEISHVYIDWSGEITAGRAIYYTDPCNPFPQEVGIYASLGDNPYSRYVPVLGGEQTYPAPEPFNCVSEFRLIGSSTWSDLLDGQGAIRVQYTEVIMMNGSYIEHGSVVLDSAQLVFDGTVVPEPATLALLVLGFAQIIRRRNYSPPSADKSQ